MTISPVNHNALSAPQVGQTDASGNDTGSFWGSEGFSFKNVLDMVNPLQQIPGVSTIYRSLTGDTISPGARLAGGALLGGPIGFVSALFNEIVHTQTGKDIGDNVMAIMQGNDSVQVAQNDSASSTNMPDHLSANQRNNYNAYVQTQHMMG